MGDEINTSLVLELVLVTTCLVYFNKLVDLLRKNKYKSNFFLGSVISKLQG